MYVTMKEYFNAKGIDFDKLEILSKSPTGFYESVTFYGGITARLMKGHHVGKPCVWFPEEAKLVNKLLNAQVLNRHSAHQFILENHNNAVLLFEKFGDISIMWTIPIIEKVVNNAYDAINGQFKAASYVGHSLMFSLKNLGYFNLLIDKGTFPELKSLDDSSDQKYEWLKDFFSYLELTLGAGFPKLLINGLGFKFLGYGETSIYLENECNELICFSYYRDERLNPLLKDVSLSTKNMIDQCIVESIESLVEIN